ncbi:hypothetical protein BPAE_0037g00280 [Botrytis paeoniae]|uniref:Uncharacterized protein n=1 Tax=Botrytis paeoniae TaxID=278948 RepID=A0A4Z1FSH8_9HELO|nr:hypothetical protein BPAE_0037g00280 [Botrytis paeoniae]
MARKPGMVLYTENPPGHSATVMLRRFENESQDVGAAAVLNTEPCRRRNGILCKVSRNKRLSHTVRTSVPLEHHKMFQLAQKNLSTLKI